MLTPSGIVICFAISSIAASAKDWHVGPGQRFTSLAATVAAAAPGDTIHVHGGSYAEGSLHITKTLALLGAGRPVLDGRHEQEIVTITASDVILRGFVLRNGGRSSTRELAGVRVDSAQRVTVDGNTLVDCDYGVYLARTRGCKVLNNVIHGRPDREQNCGNGIHLWSCEQTQVAGNEVSGHRDGVYLEFSSHSLVEGNVVDGNLRYGLHFMTSHDSQYRRNRFSRNGAGVAVMYSHNVEMTSNVFEYSWGGSAYGLLLKDMTDSIIRGNDFHHNSAAIYAQGATRTKFESNQFRENGWAVRILSNGSDNSFTNNNFSRNSFDIGTNGQLPDHIFKNNYWDRYEGYDLKRDGTGDVPFRPVSLYAVVVERAPASLFLLHSFMVHLLDRAEKAFPSVTPDTVVDKAPCMRPHRFQITVPNITPNPNTP